MGSKKIIRVRKDELPAVLVVSGMNGEQRIQSLEPAGRGKLGARVGTMRDQDREWVEEILKFEDK